MNTVEVIEQYNQFERKVVRPFSGVVKSNDELTKFVSEERHGSYISYFNFSEDRADSIVKRELDYFNQRKLSFEWKTYSTDQPNNIGEILLSNGFKQEDTESFMVLDLSKASTHAFDSSLITEVSDAQGIRDAVKVQEQVWGGDFEWQYRHLLELKQASPDSISIYVVYVDDQPVTSAWITYNENSPFAGIWGGSTVKEFRGNGYYTQLLNKRIEEAKSRGIKYLTIDASDMSKPIVTKRGFQLVSTTTGYTSPIDF